MSKQEHWIAGQARNDTPAARNDKASVIPDVKAVIPDLIRDPVWPTRVAALCGAAAVLTGVAVLLGWWLDLSALKSILPGLVSMKANTALAFVLAGVALVLLSGTPLSAHSAAPLWTDPAAQLSSHPAAQLSSHPAVPLSRHHVTAARWLALLVALIGALTLCEYLFGWSLGIDEILFKDDDYAVATPIAGRMAPSSALCFLWFGLALLGIEWEPRPGLRPAQWLALLAALLSLISLVEYAIGAPILYGFSEYTRMAAHTAAGFVLLCAGVLLARPGQGLLGALRAGRISRFDLAIYAALLLSLLTLTGAGTWFYRAQEQQSRQQVEAELDAIARLKVAQIVQWRAERLGDAGVLTDSAFFADGVVRWMATAQTADTERILQDLGAVRQYGYYQDVMLVDASGRVRLSTTERAAVVHPEESLALASALQQKRPMLTDLHVTPDDPTPHLNLIAPILHKTGAGTISIAAVILTINARDFLYPMLQSWPTVSASAETLLVRRDGDSALFLNDIRHQSNTALTLRIPLSQQQVPAVMAVLGVEGVFRGFDYRGVKVLSVLYAIPDSPWFMVTKIDEAEAMVPWRKLADLIVALLAVLVLGFIVASLMFWRQRKTSHSLRASTHALGQSNRAYRVLSQCNHALVHASEEQQLLDRVCTLLVQHGGYRCAWIGFAEDDAGKSVRAVAEYGFKVGYVQSLHLSWGDGARAHCPPATPSATGNPAWRAAPRAARPTTCGVTVRRGTAMRLRSRCRSSSMDQLAAR